MADETFEILTLMISGMGTVLGVIQVLRPIPIQASSNPDLPLSMRIHRTSPEVDIVICPNCYQPFDAAWSANYNVETVRVNGTRILSCPRCWFTFEA